MELYKLACKFEKITKLAIYGKIDPYLQHTINNMGYKPSLKVDGILGPETEAALNWFKGIMKLPANERQDEVLRKLQNVGAKIDQNSSFMTSPPKRNLPPKSEMPHKPTFISDTATPYNIDPATPNLR